MDPGLTKPSWAQLFYLESIGKFPNLSQKDKFR
jgi:hypothetical protein